eukprot:gene6414-7071_t
MFKGWTGGKKEPQEESLGTLALNAAQPPENNKSQQGGQSSVHGFDPSALERAAKAARELDKSTNAKNAIQAILSSEVTKQKEHEAERAKFQAMQQELAIRRLQEEEQTAARTLEKQTQHERQRAEYKDQLERKRMVDQINAQRHLQEEERKKAEESLQRQEEIRRKTLEHEAILRQQTEMARVKAETEGRITQERANHDLILEKKTLESRETRTTILEGIKLAGSTIGAGIQEFVTDRTKLLNTAGVITAVAFGVYGARVSTGLVGRYIESRLGKPSLVRDTSRTSVLHTVKHPVVAAKRFFSSKNAENALKDIVLDNALETRLKRVAVSTSNTKRNKAPFRHLLLHGPPGTGKTMFAKGLARDSGLDYAIMTGGDIAPLGKDGVTEIHKIFDWASTSRKGVLIFVDEADAFLRKRSTERISEDMRNALNAFLYRTGEASDKFMIVYASNQPEQFDWAINDRIDEMVEFGLPSYNERVRMIGQYIEKYLKNPIKGSVQISLFDYDIELVESIAHATEGFSGREISKLAIAWQAAAYGTADATIDKKLFMQVLEDSLESKRQKISWLSPADAEKIIKNSS